jgi:hypothetical protein
VIARAAEQEEKWIHEDDQFDGINTPVKKLGKILKSNRYCSRGNEAKGQSMTIDVGEL